MVTLIGGRVCVWLALLAVWLLYAPGTPMCLNVGFISMYVPVYASVSEAVPFWLCSRRYSTVHEREARVGLDELACMRSLS